MLEAAIVIFLLGYFLGYKSSKNEVENLKKQLRAGQAASAQPTAPAAPVYGTTVQAASATATRKQEGVDNAVLLLYFGAFLFLSSIGLFLAFGGLSGVIKSLLVALLVGLFYCGGLFLYHGSRRLKPAGVTFIAIGMILLPFFGLSLHVYAFDREQGPLVWGITSLLSIGLYLHALYSTRQAYVTYFLLGAVLSMFESGVAIIELPVFYFAWVMALTGIAFLLFARIKGTWPQLQESLKTGSAALVPISLVFTVIFSPVHGLWQVALGFLLASVYYWLAVSMERQAEVRSQLAALADGLSLVTVLLFTYHWTADMHAVAIAALTLSLFQALLLPYGHKLMSPLTYSYLGAITSLLPILAFVSALGSSALVTTAASLAIVIYGILYLTHKLGVYLAGSLTALLILPIILGAFLIEPSWGAIEYLLAYGLTSLVILGVRLQFGGKASGSDAAKAGFYISLSGVLIASIADSSLTAAVIMALLSIVFIGLSHYESEAERPGLFAFALGLQHAAVISGVLALGEGYAEQRQYLMPLAFALLATLQYCSALAGLASTSGRRKYVRYSALAAGLIGASTVLFYGETNILMILCLLLAGFITYAEGEKQENQDMRDAGLVINVAALQWLLYLAGVRTLQIYTHIWVFFLGALAAWRSSLGQSDKEHTYTVMALSVLTIPLAIQALGAGGEFYGWLLILEHVLLMMLGMVLSRPLVTRWGLWVSVAAVLYQLRDLTYLALGFLAIVIIIIAMRVLQKNNDEDSR